MLYICLRCRRTYPVFHLSCPGCGAWGSCSRREELSRDDARPIALSSIGSFILRRTRTNIEELDRLLGDGFVPGSSVLLIGPPGAGKSTLVMQVLKSVKLASLYVTGEESVQQLKVRADRLKINAKNILLLFETNVRKIAAHVGETRAKLLVIDSIQTMYVDSSDALPGSTTQIRKCAYLLRRLAQQNDLILIMVGQVTKDKKAAGPRLLEHAVDVVLQLETGENSSRFRMLLSSKNRFGSTAPRCQLSMRRSGIFFEGISA